MTIHFGLFWAIIAAIIAILAFWAILAVLGYFTSLGYFGCFGLFWSGLVWSVLNCSKAIVGLDWTGSNLDISHIRAPAVLIQSLGKKSENQKIETIAFCLSSPQPPAEQAKVRRCKVRTLAEILSYCTSLPR